ncbi:dihydrolipoyl dehydrogenase family protein [Ralstonia solanacearum]|uniref:dihydrolipoyl dehydrogenase family protein n=1 Tax=Ralstonia solanacearum TaxID=305 RepID=UPI0012A135EA|nr:NAD(P)/FAD-dependent oxidoreductase [Ralstonia solanacearum]AYB62008.1 pyridine nucleotide-disulfide oxidoreductase [Ralstonia solanacearum]
MASPVEPDGRLMRANSVVSFDLIVVGAGSAGLAAARRAAQLGARTLLIDRAEVGGTSVNRGCAPKKLLGYGATWSQAASRCLHTAAAHGREAWQDAVARIRAEAGRMHGVYRTHLAEAGVQWLAGSASLRGRGALRLLTDAGKRTLRARQIVLATGARPQPLPVPGAELACSSGDVFTWDTLPASLAIAGGGVIAVEMASTLARFGVRVTLLVGGPRVLPDFDVALSEAAARALAGCGVEVVPDADVVRVERDAVNGDGVAVYLAGPDGQPRVVRAQRVMAIIGRVPATDGLGLEAAGVTLDAHGHIAVDRHFRTRARGVHAIGDVGGCPPLTPVAVAQGGYVAERLFGKGAKLPDMAHVPMAVFCEPAIAAVGLTEAQARARWPDRPERDTRATAERIDVVERRFVSLEQRFAGTGAESLIKLVCNARSGRVLGAHVVDNAAPEIVQALAVAVRMGVRLKHLRSTVGLHPTVAEELLGA